MDSLVQKLKDHKYCECRETWTWTNDSIKDSDAVDCCCTDCREIIIDHIYSQFETSLCQMCKNCFRERVLYDLFPTMEKEEILQWLESKSWLCSDCTTKIQNEISRLSNRDVETRIRKIEYLLSKVCERLGIE
mgnify:CR=1 FL=1